MAAIKLRRGFVAEANRWAVHLREELGLAAHDVMCPFLLADHLSVPIYKLTAMPDCPEKDVLLQKSNGHDFSAAVCFEGIAAFILMNDGNEPKRQASDIAHELAHLLLRHPPSHPFLAEGLREFSPVHEREAETLGPTLLVSDAAALKAYRWITRGVHSMESLSEEWNVSRNVLQMRINLSGASRRLKAA